MLLFSSHIIQIQNEMSERALELLALPEDAECLLLDIGCGSGLSGDVLSEHGHTWIGMDISESMLRKSMYFLGIISNVCFFRSC